MRKLRPWEGEHLVQGHVPEGWQPRDLNLGPADSTGDAPSHVASGSFLPVAASCTSCEGGGRLCWSFGGSHLPSRQCLCEGAIVALRPDNNSDPSVDVAYTTSGRGVGGASGREALQSF